ncbi:MAG: hypothetical protein N2595_00165 [bacterium]|nr:hypothetical protein [bacterium]
MSTTADPLPSWWQRRSAYLATIMFFLAVFYAGWQAWQVSQRLGVTFPEAQALDTIAKIPCTLDSLPRRLCRGTPLTESLLHLASARLDTLWHARALFCGVAALSLLLITLIARSADPSHLTMLWAVTLFGTSAQWWVRTHQLGPMIMTMFGVLFAQWAWHYFYAHPSFQGMLVYLGAALVAMTATPLVVFLFIIHAGCILGILVRSRRVDAPNKVHIRPRIAASLFYLLLLLCALLLTLNGSFTPRLPRWLLTQAWWRDASLSWWTLLTAAAGSSYLSIPIVPSRASSHITPLAYAVTWVVGGLALLGLLRRHSTTPANTSWKAIPVLLPFFWTLCTSRPPTAGSNEYVAIGWPFVLLLTVETWAWLIRVVLSRLHRYRHVTTSFIITILTVVLGFAAWLTWTYFQHVAYRVALSEVADQDLAAPAHFLRRAAQPVDQLFLVCTNDPKADLRMRWYVASLLNDLSVGSAMTTTPPMLMARVTTYPALSSVTWIINHPLNPVLLTPWALTNFSLPFAVNIEMICPTSHMTAANVGHLYRLALAAAPLSSTLQRQLFRWYARTDIDTLCALISSGQATKDLSVRPPISLQPYQRAAANAALYAWASQYLRAYSTSLFPPFDNFVSSLGPPILDRERVVYLYRLHVEYALAQTNLALARAALRAARQWDRTNPYLDRLTAQLALLEDPTHYARAQRLNARAARSYERRYHRPFVEALFANMLLDKQQQRIPRAIQSCAAILRLLQQDSFIPLFVRTNTSPNATRLRADWQRERLFWEAQCHSYLALLLLSTGDYQNAVSWLSRNLDPRFDEVRRLASYEQLARLYSESGDVARALRHFETLATLATSTAQRIHWLLQAAQLHITAGDTIAAHELWSQIRELAEQLDNPARRALVRDKQYQRLMHHIERRMSVDSRDAIILALQSRAQRQPHRAAWFYRQIAHIERARLRYDAADAFFQQAMQVSPPDPDAFLDAALYFYRRLQYPRAAIIFSNLFVQLSSPQRDELQNRDWRYAVLSAFYTSGVPTSESVAMAWLAGAATNFSVPAAYYNARGNLLALYDQFDAATNAFLAGIATNNAWTDNYLDLGYLLCTRADSEGAAAVLDQLDALPDISHRLYGDWRHVILHHVSIRPYLPDKEADENH